MGFGIRGLGCGIRGLGFGIRGFGFGIRGLGFGVWVQSAQRVQVPKNEVLGFWAIVIIVHVLG